MALASCVLLFYVWFLASGSYSNCLVWLLVNTFGFYLEFNMGGTGNCTVVGYTHNTKKLSNWKESIFETHDQPQGKH